MPAAPVGKITKGFEEVKQTPNGESKWALPRAAALFGYAVVVVVVDVVVTCCALHSIHAHGLRCVLLRELLVDRLVAAVVLLLQSQLLHHLVRRVVLPALNKVVHNVVLEDIHHQRKDQEYKPHLEVWVFVQAGERPHSDCCKYRKAHHDGVDAALHHAQTYHVDHKLFDVARHAGRAPILARLDSRQSSQNAPARDCPDEKVQHRYSNCGIEKNVKEVVIAGIIANLLLGSDPDLQTYHAEEKIQHVQEQGAKHLLRHIKEPDHPRPSVGVLMVPFPNQGPEGQHPE